MGGMLELCMRYEKDQAAISTHCRKAEPEGERIGRGTVTKRANRAPEGQSDILVPGPPVAAVLRPLAPSSFQETRIYINVNTRGQREASRSLY